MAELLDHELWVIGEKRLELAKQNRPGERAPAYHYPLQLGESAIALVKQTHCEAPRSWWKRAGLGLAYEIAWSHTSRREEGSYQPVAAAFLAALEAECPAPPWLYSRDSSA